MIYTVTYQARRLKNSKIKYDPVHRNLTILGKTEWGWIEDILHFNFAIVDDVTNTCVTFLVALHVGQTLERLYCDFERIDD